MAVDLLMDALTDIRLGLLANNIGVDVLVDVNVFKYKYCWPDFLNVPHFGHVISLLVVMANVLVLTGVVIGARTISSRSGIGRRDAYWCAVAEVHT